MHVRLPVAVPSSALAQHSSSHAPCGAHLKGEVQACDAGVVEPVQDGALIADVVNHLVAQHQVLIDDLDRIA